MLGDRRMSGRWCKRCGEPFTPEGVCVNCATAPERRAHAREAKQRVDAALALWVGERARLEAWKHPLEALFAALLPDERSWARLEMISRGARLVIHTDNQVEEMPVPSMIGLKIFAFIETRRLCQERGHRIT